MNDLFSEGIPHGAMLSKLQIGQRLSRSRFVLTSEVFRTELASVYWLAQDRDENMEVVLYFPSESISSDQEALEGFFGRVVSWVNSVDAPWHSVSHVEPESKPYPFIVLKSSAGISLEQRLKREGVSTTWEDVEPVIEKITQHLVQLHQQDQVHGRLSPDNIRFSPSDDVLLLGPQLDRLALETLKEITGESIPTSWDPHASPECLESGNCEKTDEVYALASILLESLRHLGIHVQLPKHLELKGKVRFGNLLVPKSVKQALMDALGDDVKSRPNTALRLSALLGFNVVDVLEERQVDSLEGLVPDASERTRIFIRSMLRPKFLMSLTLFIGIVLGGWLIADWHQKQIVHEQLQAQTSLNNILALEVRDAAPNDLDAGTVFGSSTLIVRTKPDEALLTLSGPGIAEVMEELSPVEWNQLQSGAYQLSVLSVGRAPTNLYPFLEVGKTNFIEIELAEAFTDVKLATQPAGGTFRFQDHTGEWVTGLTPAKVSLPLGEYLVHFSLNGQNLSEPLHLKRFQSRGMELKATFGDCSLQVYSYPEKADVYINSKLMGQTPLSLAGLVSGNIQLELRLQDHANSSQQIVLDSENLNAVRIVLQPQESITASDSQ